MDNQIQILNEGQVVKHTNYWDHSLALAGYFYLSWNAGAARLLVPDIQKTMLREIRKAKEVIISRGPLQGRDGLELLFEDNSNAPYAIHIVSEMSDRMLPANEQCISRDLI